MIRLYIKQSLAQIRQNPLMSTVSIFGTALAICLVMVMVIAWRVKYAPVAPEVNLDRTLFIHMVCEQGKVNTEINNMWRCSPALMERVVKPVDGVVTATAVTDCRSMLLATSDGSRRMKADGVITDPAFWTVYPMDFLAGRPLSEADVRVDGTEPVVVCETVARTLFGRTDVVGATFVMNRRPCRVVGVVKDVSLTAVHAYAQVWRRYYDASAHSGDNGWRGDYKVSILVSKPGDFPRVRAGIDREIAKLNTESTEYNVRLLGGPDDAVAIRLRGWMLYEPDTTGVYLMNFFCMLIVLLVPALNLSGLSSSRMQQRMSELGVRKAFGCTSGGLIRQILGENLVLTLIGGVLGLAFSFASVWLLREWLFLTSDAMKTSGELTVSAVSLFSPLTFLMAFAFCLLMNLLSAGIPAWIASRGNIVESLYDK